MGINVLGLFDGMACGRLALERAEIKVDKYIAYEIDPYAIKVAQKNWPDIIQCGDVETADFSVYKDKIDLLIGGSPCQGFTQAGKLLNFADPRSKLFFEFVRALKTIKPKYFLLENVKMKKEWVEIISGMLGVEPIEINSNLVSAQNRKRLYWTNIPIKELPIDKGINLEDILRDEDEDKFPLSKTHHAAFLKSYPNWKDSPRNGKAKTLLASYYKQPPHCPYVKSEFSESGYRRLSPVECESLQTLPAGYTEGVSNMQRYKMLGNGWTVDVIAHIFKGLKGFF